MTILQKKKLEKIAQSSNLEKEDAAYDFGFNGRNKQKNLANHVFVIKNITNSWNKLAACMRFLFLTLHKVESSMSFLGMRDSEGEASHRVAYSWDFIFRVSFAVLGTARSSGVQNEVHL